MSQTRATGQPSAARASRSGLADSASDTGRFGTPSMPTQAVGHTSTRRRPPLPDSSHWA